MLLTFVFVSLEGSCGEVGAWHEEASSEQPIGRSPKEEASSEQPIGRIPKEEASSEQPIGSPKEVDGIRVSDNWKSLFAIFVFLLICRSEVHNLSRSLRLNLLNQKMLVFILILVVSLFALTSCLLTFLPYLFFLKRLLVSFDSKNSNDWQAIARDLNSVLEILFQ